MQASRQKILELLKSHGAMTVDELGEVLGLTAVTVRHHLDVLRSEGLVCEPEVRHRSTPGRPQYSYRLTTEAVNYLPKAYDTLANNIIAWIKESTAPDEVGPVFASMANKFLNDAPRPNPADPITQRLDRAVVYLNEKGYLAHWEPVEQGYLLHTSNCPYLAVAGHHGEVCGIDVSLVSSLVGGDVERTGRVVEGRDSCSYLIRSHGAVTA